MGVMEGKQADSALRESEDAHRLLFDASPVALFVFDADTLVPIAANDAALRLYGYAREELMRLQVSELVATGHKATLAAWDDAESTGTSRHRRKDGSEFVAEYTQRSLTFSGRRACIAVINDITERNRVDQRRAALASLVEASDDVIIGMTLDGVITSWNLGAQHLFGYAAAEVVGKSISILIPEARAHEAVAILASLARGEVSRFDTVRRRKDGSELEVSVTTSPVRDATGRVIGVAKVARDITDRRRSEQALARAKEAAEAANRELEAFSYSVAHDLRAPLRAMNGFAHLLLDAYRAQLDETGLDWLQEIFDNAKKMAELIDALLALSRVTRAGLRRETVDLSGVVRAVCAELSKSQPERTVEWVIRDEARVAVDPTLAKALLDNLLGNAWKFTSKLPEARIEFGETTVEGTRAFYVRDNGAGFDMAYASKLFSPFQRLHTQHEFSGTGIGLATVQRIVRMHGGRVWAEGSVGGGATFFFSIPGSAAGAA